MLNEDPTTSGRPPEGRMNEDPRSSCVILRMKIDRQRFLFLVGALAAGVSAIPACGGSPPPPDRPASGGDPTHGQAPAEIVIPPVAAVAPTSPSSTGPGEARSAPTADPVASAPPTPKNAARPNPYDGTPVTAQDCSPMQNREGKAPACVLSPPGPTCESFRDTQKECPTLNQLLKPRVAAAAIECLRRRSGTKEICEFNVSSICAYEALLSACLDPAARAACTSVVAKCGGARSAYNKMTRESCEAGVSAIADAKRAKFISCISESCRFETCLTYL
jgi:hypothetical protein